MRRSVSTIDVFAGQIDGYEKGEDRTPVVAYPQREANDAGTAVELDRIP